MTRLPAQPARPSQHPSRRSRTRRRLGALLATATAGTLLAACGSSGESGEETDASGSESSESSESTDFPVSIEHTYGETTIESQPERVATVAWANHEVPLALGVVPVGMSKATWGDDDGDGVLPWVEDRLSELDAETPVLFDETEGIDFEAVAGTEPDVILASYSGLTQEDYDTLSKIAPTIAYPELAWGTSVDTMIEMNSEAIGMAEEGEQLIEDLDQQVDDAMAERPDLQDASIMFTYLDPSDLSQIGFYTSHDTRPGFLDEHGMTMPELVEETSAETEEFYQTISAEKADRLDDVDIMVAYGADDTLAQLQADPLIGKIPAVRRGSVVVLEDSTPLAASANPSPLSIPWGIEEYLDLMDTAAAKVG